MPEESISVEEGTPTKGFLIVRKGYDPDEVDSHLAENDVAFCELEEFAARLKHELSDAKLEIARLKAAEQESVDKAMQAVFDAKERILKRARQKASEIEDGARDGGRIPPVDDAVADNREPVQTAPLQSPVEAVEFEPSPSEESGSAQPSEPAEVLRQMLSEAGSIRAQLQNGLSAAFDEMNRLQRNAEVRATAFLDDARSEAAQIRSAGKTRPASGAPLGDTDIAVTLQPDEPVDGTGQERQSRYTRNSAKLPRIGEGTGESVLASMNQLRNKLREAEEVALQVQEESAS